MGATTNAGARIVNSLLSLYNLTMASRIERRVELEEKSGKMVIVAQGTSIETLNALQLQTLQSLGQFEITWIIHPKDGFVASSTLPEIDYFELPTDFSPRGFWDLLVFFRNHKFKAALLLYTPMWVRIAAMFAMITLRGGVRENPLDYLFLNSSIGPEELTGSESQRLHKTVSHCLDLVQDDLGLPPLNLDVQDTGIFAKLGIAPQQYFAVCPFLSIGKVNWTLDKYVDLINQLSKSFPIAMVGINVPSSHAEPLRKQLVQNKNILWLVNKLNGAQLLDTVSQCRVFVGTINTSSHLAAASGVPVITVASNYSGDEVERWRPRGRLSMTVQPPPQQNSPEGIRMVSIDRVIEQINKFAN